VPLGQQSTPRNLVSAYFQVTAAAWRDIYAKTDLYSQIYQSRSSLVLALVDELALLPGARVLEVGCGPGLTTVALARREFTVLAIDAASSMLAMTRAFADCSGVGHRISTAMCDIRSMAAANDKFDLVVMVGVTEWLDSLQQPMSEIARVMKPGGHVVVTGDNSWSMHCVLDPALNPLLAPVKRKIRTVLRRLGWRDNLPVCHLRSVRQFQESIKAAGLRPVRYVTLGFGPFSVLNRKLVPDTIGSKLHRILQRWADRGVPVLRSMGHVCVAVAIKPADVCNIL
jgi:SAM-dependent methyltransferase